MNFSRKPQSFHAVLAFAFLLPLSIGFSVAGAGAADAASPAVMIPHGTVTLVAEKPAIDPHADLWVALHFVMEPGWHTYWVNPGDSGEAPRLTWHLPQGLAAGAISWPAPKRLPPGPNIMDFGYTDDAVLLVPLRNTGGLAAGSKANLGLTVSVVVCRELCIPGRAQLSLTLPVTAPLGGAMPPASKATTALFSSARSHVPKPLPAAWKARAVDNKDEFVLQIDSGRSISHATFFPLDEDQVANAAPQSVEPMPTGFRIHLHKSDQLTAPIKRLRGVIETDDAAYTVSADVASSPAGRPSNTKPSR